MTSYRQFRPVDLSEFLSESPERAAEGIRARMLRVHVCSKIQTVKLLGSRSCDRVKADVITAALKALLPEPGQERTIIKLEMNGNIEEFSKADPPDVEDKGNLTVESLVLHRNMYMHDQAIIKLIDNLPNLGITVKRVSFGKSYDVCNIDGDQMSYEKFKDRLENGNDYVKCHETFVTVACYGQSNPVREFINPIFVNLQQIHANMSRGGGVAVAVFQFGLTSVHDTSPGLELLHEYEAIVKWVAPDAQVIRQRHGMYTCTSEWSPGGQASSGQASRALSQLTEKWKARECGDNVHSLVVVIPYGGHYREDEMRAINAAIDEGIIVVCAAGDTTPHPIGFYPHIHTSYKHIPGIAFPASMGNVLCVGAADENNQPEVDSPSGREVDCVMRGTVYNIMDKISIKGTGISVVILSGLIALILSFIKSSLSKIHGICPDYNHVSIIREVLQQTTTHAKHHPHSGYGLVTSRLFTFSKHELKKLLSSITQERVFRTIPGSASEMTDQCKFNSEILCNVELNRELQLPVTLDGGGIKVAVIDEDFPDILKTNYKADELETEMHLWDECTTSLSENAELLKGSMESLKERACSLRGKIPYVAQEALQLEEKAKSIEGQIDSMNEEIGFKFTSVKDSHGLQCALVVANTTPRADLFLVNSRFDSTSLATEIENLVEKRPHVIVCSLGFDQFNLQLSKAVNKAINAGIIPVFSAGNVGHTGSNTISYPSRLGNVLCIGAHTWHGTSHSFRSVGREVDFLAPGEFMILGKYPVSGTSFAAPAVAAFIALILQYVDKIVSGEWKQRPLEDKYKSIDAWSENPPGSDEWSWNQIPLNVACRNVYVMRELLRQMTVHRTEHSDSAGYGNLDIRRLLKDLEPEDIHSIVQNFHKPSS